MPVERTRADVLAQILAKLTEAEHHALGLAVDYALDMGRDLPFSTDQTHGALRHIAVALAILELTPPKEGNPE